MPGRGCLLTRCRPPGLVRSGPLVLKWRAKRLDKRGRHGGAERHGAAVRVDRRGGTIEEVADILRNVERLPQWWGAVYLSAAIVEPGDEDGIGRVVAFHSRGWLPYTLRWRGRVVEANRPHHWTIDATGDLVGRGVWTLTQQGPVARIAYDWRVLVEKTDAP